jgi:hypothetical protein
LLRSFALATVGLYFVVPTAWNPAADCKSMCQLLSAFVFKYQRAQKQAANVKRMMVRMSEVLAEREPKGAA